MTTWEERRKVEARMRATIKLHPLRLTVEAVSEMARHSEGEFAAFVVADPKDVDFAWQRERAYDFITDPDCPFRLSRETATRIFIEYVI